MKIKLLTLLSVALVSLMSGQTIQILDNTSSVVIPSGSTVNVITTASTHITTKFKVKNNSATSPTVTVYRTAIVTNATGTITANFPFCFACNCLPPTTTSAVCTFTANEIAPNASNTSGLWPEINEAPTVGFSKVKYKIVNNSNAADSTVLYVTYNGAVGLNEKSFDNFNLSISPNPVNDMFVVKHTALESKNASIKVLNIVGSVVKELRIENNETQTRVDASQLSAGIYFVSVYSNNVLIVSKKIIVSK